MGALVNVLWARVVTGMPLASAQQASTSNASCGVSASMCGMGWCFVLFDLHTPIASRADFSQAVSMKGLFPRLQHRSLQSMNDLFSLLNQTQCCHFLDPKKQKKKWFFNAPYFVPFFKHYIFAHFFSTCRVIFSFYRNFFILMLQTQKVSVKLKNSVYNI